MNASAFANRPEQAKSWHPTVTSTMGLAAVGSGKLKLECDRSLRIGVKAKVQQGDYLGAIALLTELIYRNPNSASDYNNRGLVYFQSGEMDLAIEDYNKALELNPQLDGAYNNRGNYYAAMQCFKQALADYESALDLNPTHVRAWINQAIAFRELGLYDRALDNLDFALHFSQLQGHIYAQRGRTYDLRGDWNCAIADYQRALIHLPESDRLRQQVKRWSEQLLHPNAL